MGAINQHWYSINEGIAYPVDENATAIDDDGNRLPSSIIVDLSIRWSRNWGQYAFLSSVSVTPDAVSITLQATDGFDDVPFFNPLAVLTVTRPFDQGRLYALLPQLPGVGGWVAFGGGVEGGFYSGKFASPAQSLITPRAARAYRQLPVIGMRAMGASVALTGLIQLRTAGPLEIVHEQHVIGGLARDCAVIRMADDPTSTGPSALETFNGECGGRPDSRSCGDPQPVEFIGSVGPNCDGVITVAMEGCASPIPGDEPGLVAMACALGLGDACPPLLIPDSSGSLPRGSYPAYVFTPPVPPVPHGPAHGLAGGGGVQECFASNDMSVLDMIVQSGIWHIVDDATDEWRDCPDDGGDPSLLNVLESNTASGRCVITHSSGGYGLDELMCLADIKLMEGPRGARHAAQVIFGYQARVNFPDQHVYYMAEADYDKQRLTIAFFAGTKFLTLETIDAPSIQLDKWYELSIEASAAENLIIAKLNSLEDDSVATAVSCEPMENYPVTLGLSGVATSRAISRFSMILIVPRSSGSSPMIMV